MSVDDDLKEMMRDLGQTLARAIATSPKAADTVRKIRRQGYSLYLAVDGKEGDSESATARLRRDSARVELPSGQTPSPKPGFLLNQDDVSFLESVGIDATRPGRRRRTP